MINKNNFTFIWLNPKDFKVFLSLECVIAACSVVFDYAESVRKYMVFMLLLTEERSRRLESNDAQNIPLKGTEPETEILG